jgi:sugar phosphate isomerase/epimerase
MVLCASDLRPLHSAGVEPLVRAASEAGAEGVHFGRGFILGDLAGAAPALLKAGLTLASTCLPLAPRPLGKGKRLPALSARDPEERLAAITLAGEGLDAVAGVGARWALLTFGPAELPFPRRELAGAFARRELDPGEVAAAELAIVLGARKAVAESLLDGCRWSIERLARHAEARAVTLALPVGGSPWDVPSPREALSLLETFVGAPVTLTWDPGRLSTLRPFGMRLPEARIAALAAACGAAFETDAVGVEAGYLPGLGERDELLPARPSEKWPKDAPIIVSGFPDTTDQEIARAVSSASSW